MAEKIINNLIYGEHKIPKRTRPWKDRVKAPLIIVVVLLVIAGAAYKYANYREEGRVALFLDEVFGGQLDEAYANWDHAGSSYTLEDFATDWGKGGYYTGGMTTGKIIDSNSKGSGVVVYVEIDPAKRPVALMVNKETLKLSFSPTNKYR